MQLLDALELSKLTMKTVKQNLWWAFAYNIVSFSVSFKPMFTKKKKKKSSESALEEHLGVEGPRLYRATFAPGKKEIEVMHKFPPDGM